MGMRIMNNHNQSMTDMVQTIGKLAVAQQQLARQAEQQYSFKVEAILRDKCRDPLRPKLWIEKTGTTGVAGYELKTLDGFLKGSGYLA
jgi:hypothetical protein